MLGLLGKLMSAAAGALPSLVVLDLDMTCWSPEMYTLSVVPTLADAVKGPLRSAGEGNIGVRSGGKVVRLFDGALQMLQEIHSNPDGPRLAVASTADTPLAVRIANACIDILEVFPGVTFRQVLARGWPAGFTGHIQIGRSPPLSSCKATSHFPAIAKATKVSYNQMLFFDDCNWEDNCGHVELECVGVVGHQTPTGMTYDHWLAGLKKFQSRAM